MSQLPPPEPGDLQAIRPCRPTSHNWYHYSICMDICLFCGMQRQR